MTQFFTGRSVPVHVLNLSRSTSRLRANAELSEEYHKYGTLFFLFFFFFK